MIRTVLLALFLAVAAWPQTVAPPLGLDPLPSWRDGPARKAIVEFVAAVTTDGPGYVPPAQRIATFDNDGTLWAEQPMYFQVEFAMDEIVRLTPSHPEWKEQEPMASILRGDRAGALAGGKKARAAIRAAIDSGMTTEEYGRAIRQWLSTARHARSGRPYTEMVYQPMLELLDYLRANGFKTYIVSGGGVEFLREFTEQVYGVPPEQVIGSTGEEAWEMRPEGPVILKLPGVDSVAEGEGKPLSIHRLIGRRPIASFGNSDGDLQMLQWTAAGPGKHLCLLVHHTDAEREWSYDRQSNVGKLDKALDEAVKRGWVVVDMRTEWARVFPFDP